MTTANHVKNNWEGMLVIGDVHGDYRSFSMAVDYAARNNLFLLSAGDLVDRGPQPYEVVKNMHELMHAGAAGFVVGNHDDKFRRFGHGAKVSFSRDARQTFVDVGEERKDEFIKMYVDIVEYKMFSDMFHKFDDIVVAHAASHPAMWDPSVKFGSEAKARALFGEVNGEKDDEGYPVRLYNWINEVPMGKTIIVGHDRAPVFDKLLEAPLERSNSSGGKTIFIDTGCGKGGFLSGVEVIHDRGKFKVSKFVEFK